MDKLKPKIKSINPSSLTAGIRSHVYIEFEVLPELSTIEIEGCEIISQVLYRANTLKLRVNLGEKENPAIIVSVGEDQYKYNDLIKVSPSTEILEGEIVEASDLDLRFLATKGEIVEASDLDLRFLATKEELKSTVSKLQEQIEEQQKYLDILEESLEALGKLVLRDVENIEEVDPKEYFLAFTADEKFFKSNGVSWVNWSERASV